MPGNEERTQRGRIEDIRERGFSDRFSVEKATDWVDGHSTKLTAEEIYVSEAAGRVLAENIEAAEAIPPADRASSDGYAVRSEDTVGAGDYNPLDLAICECDELPPAAATPVVAGAPLPRGADAILPFESARAHGAALEIFGAVAEGCGVEREGQQVQAGAVLIERGRMLLPQDIGLIASLGIHCVHVIRRPRVRLIVSAPKSHGDLCPQGNANGPMLSALVARDGGVVEAMVLGTGQREEIVQALVAPDADLILVAGRTGTGWDDEAPLALAETGELQIHGIALRPGGSAGMGVVGTAPVLLLPGDPLDCWSAYEMFAGRLLRRLAGRYRELPYPVREAEVGRKIVSAIGITDLYRVSLVDGRAEAIGSAESGGLASAVRADGFVVVPAPLEGYAPGVRVPVHLYRAADASRT
jgi:molybdopterin molybdotransferase